MSFRLNPSGPRVGGGGRPAGVALTDARLPRNFYPIEAEVAVHTARNEYRLLQVAQGSLVPNRAFHGQPAAGLGPTEWLMAYLPDDASGLHLRHAHPVALPRPLETWQDTSVPAHLTFSLGGDLLAAVYEHELRIRVWDVPSGALVAERTTDGAAPHAAFAPDGRRLVVSGRHGARAYDRPNRVLDTVAVLAEPEVVSLAAAHDHSELAVVGWVYGLPLQLYRWALPPGRPAERVDARVLAVVQGGRWADWDPAGRGFVYTGAHGRWRVEDEAGARLDAPALSDVRYGPDGRLWVLEDHRVGAGSMADGDPTVWENDPASQSAGMTLKCVAPGRGFALVGRRDGRVLRVASAGGAVASWSVLDSAVLGLAVSADGTRAAAGGERGEVRLLDPVTGIITDVAGAHRAAVPAVAFGPDFLVTGSADRRVRLWTHAGEPIATLTMRGPVAKVLVSTDGSSLLVHVQGERAVRRWRLDVLFREWAALGLGIRRPNG